MPAVVTLCSFFSFFIRVVSELAALTLACFGLSSVVFIRQEISTHAGAAWSVTACASRRW
jgi:hypothetical protein